MRNSVQALALFAAMMLAGCSTYQTRWESARDSVDRKISPYVGAYSGRWESTRMPGTGGNLWCILSDAGPGTYRAEFKATWHGVFRSEHVAMLKMTDARAFHGEASIEAWIGSGTYSCDGKLHGGELSATYNATYDDGTFLLRRMPAGKKCE